MSLTIPLLVCACSSGETVVASSVPSTGVCGLTEVEPILLAFGLHSSTLEIQCKLRDCFGLVSGQNPVEEDHLCPTTNQLGLLVDLEDGVHHMVPLN